MQLGEMKIERGGMDVIVECEVSIPRQMSVACRRRKMPKKRDKENQNDVVLRWEQNEKA